MDSLQDTLRHNDELCEQCATVDFPSLFGSEIKAFRTGTLSSIVDNDTCPFCRLMSDAINKSWMSPAANFGARSISAVIVCGLRRPFGHIVKSTQNDISLKIICGMSNFDFDLRWE